MITIKHFIVAILLSGVVVNALAATYRCESPDGSVRFSDRSCAGDSETVKTYSDKRQDESYNRESDKRVQELEAEIERLEAEQAERDLIQACEKHIARRNDLRTTLVTDKRRSVEAIKGIGVREVLWLRISGFNTSTNKRVPEKDYPCVLHADKKTINRGDYEIIEK